MIRIRLTALMTALLTVFSGFCACGENAAGQEEFPANGTIREEKAESTETLSGEESPAGDEWMTARMTGTAFIGNPGAVVSVLLSTPSAGGETWQDEILYTPFDAEKGLYDTEREEKAGDRVQFLGWEEENTVYTVKLKDPGKYTLSALPFYVVSGESAELKKVQDRVELYVNKFMSNTEKDTAKKLYAFLLTQVRSGIPKNRAEELSEVCRDPMNCLLTGYATRDSYGPLYRLLLRRAGIESIPVWGRVDEQAREWVMMRLDGTWLYADPAMDDIMDKGGNRYFAFTSEALKDRYAPDAESAEFIRNEIDTGKYDALIGRFREKYTPPAPFPDMIGILKRTAAEYGKAGKMAKRFNPPKQFNNTTFYLDTIRVAECVTMTARDPDGKKDEKISFTYGHSDGAFVTKMLKDGSNLLTLYDYNPENAPTKKDRFSESFLIMKNAVRDNEYTIRTPLKKEQMPGWNAESFRFFRYGGDGTIRGCGTTLVNDEETVSVEALFDQEGRTTGYAAAATPKGGYETRWEGNAEGRVTCFRAGRDGDAAMLREMNERIDLPLYGSFRTAVTEKYPELFDENGALKDPEVRLYCLSLSDDREFRGDQIWAVRGDLIRWNDRGGLRLETETQDVDGNEVDLMGLEKEEGLRLCRPVSIEPGEEPAAEAEKPSEQTV